MSNIKQILPIVLIYEERGWTKATTDCLEAAGFTGWKHADREGVGSMSRAFNRAVRPYINDPGTNKYIWFITNVTFPPEMPGALLRMIEDGDNCAAVHPAFDSDHPHIRTPNGTPDVPFVEWTAPLISIEALRTVGLLDEKMPYVHFDLDWSHRARQLGYTLKVCGDHRLGHTYLWKDAPEPISRLRRDLRSIKHPDSVARMVEKWGPGWINTLCPTKTCG